MIEKLYEREYKRIQDYDDPETQNYLCSVLPTVGTAYAKLIKVDVDYGAYRNEISFTCAFVLDPDSNVIDRVMFPTKPFEIRTSADFEALRSLFESFKDDVKAVCESENPVYSA